AGRIAAHGRDPSKLAIKFFLFSEYLRCAALCRPRPKLDKLAVLMLDIRSNLLNLAAFGAHLRGLWQDRRAILAQPRQGLFPHLSRGAGFARLAGVEALMMDVC